MLRNWNQTNSVACVLTRLLACARSCVLGVWKVLFDSGVKSSTNPSTPQTSVQSNLTDKESDEHGQKGNLSRLEEELRKLYRTECSSCT